MCLDVCLSGLEFCGLFACLVWWFRVYLGFGVLECSA